MIITAKSLDALWDALTGIGTSTRLEIIHFNAAEPIWALMPKSCDRY